MQKAMNFNVVIVSFKGNDYRIHFWYMSKIDGVNLPSDITILKKGTKKSVKMGGYGRGE